MKDCPSCDGNGTVYETPDGKQVALNSVTEAGAIQGKFKKVTCKACSGSGRWNRKPQ